MKAPRRDSPGERSVADFGEQWTHFQDNPGYYGSLALFADLIQPFFRPDDFRGATVADIGSGTGRIVRMLAGAGAARIVAVEPSAAMEVLKANTRELAERICYRQQTGDEFKSDDPLDFVISMGVLHHIPNPEPVVARMRAALRPGGHAIIWLYGREGNGLYLALARPLRGLTTRLPHRGLVALCTSTRHPSVRLSGRLPSPAAAALELHDEPSGPSHTRSPPPHHLRPAESAVGEVTTGEMKRLHYWRRQDSPMFAATIDMGIAGSLWVAPQTERRPSIPAGLHRVLAARHKTACFRRHTRV